MDLKRGDAHAQEGAGRCAGRQTLVFGHECNGLWYDCRVEWVVLEREFPTPVTPDMVRQLAAGTTCLDLYRVEPVRSYLTPDGLRMVCIFRAPDAEAMRAVVRANDMPSATVWASTLHTP